jgi:hypothetical protein
MTFGSVLCRMLILNSSGLTTLAPRLISTTTTRFPLLTTTALYNGSGSSTWLWLTDLDRSLLELLCLIFEAVDNIEKNFLLRMAGPLLWPLALRHIEKRQFLPYLGCWAGTSRDSLGPVRSGH